MSTCNLLVLEKLGSYQLCPKFSLEIDNPICRMLETLTNRSPTMSLWFGITYIIEWKGSTLFTNWPPIMRDEQSLRLWKININIRGVNQMQIKYNWPRLLFQILRDGIAKVNKSFLVDVETTNTSKSLHGRNPKHLMRNHIVYYEDIYINKKNCVWKESLKSPLFSNA